MNWTVYHSFGLFATMIAVLSIIITARLVFQKHKTVPVHNRLQQFLAGGARRISTDPGEAASGHATVGLEERDHWNAAILAQNDEAAIRGLREDYRHQNRSLNASVHERDIVYEDGTVIIAPPPAYTSIAPRAGPAEALSPLSAPAPRSITSSTSTTMTTTTTMLPPREHTCGEAQPILSSQTSTMSPQHFNVGSGNRCDLPSSATSTPEHQTAINDAAEVSQRPKHAQGVFNPLVAYEALENRAEARQRMSDAAAARQEMVRHADLNPVPNTCYYRVDPPQDLEERIRTVTGNILPGLTILGDFRAQQRDTPLSAPPAQQDGVPPRTRTPGIPRPMVFGHRPILKGPMPSQAAIFADDEDENDQSNGSVFGLQDGSTRGHQVMDSAGASGAEHPRVRTSGTPRPMVFGTRPVFCARMPSQAVTVQSDHEDDDSDATIRGGALENARSWKDEKNHGKPISSKELEFEDDDGDESEILVVHEVIGSSGDSADGHFVTVAAHDNSLVNCRENTWASDVATGHFSSPLYDGGSGGDLEQNWVLVPRPSTEISANENIETSWVGRRILSGANSTSDGMAGKCQILKDDMISQDEKLASACSIYSVDELTISAVKTAFRPWKSIKASKAKKKRPESIIARSKVNSRDGKTKRVSQFVRMRHQRKRREEGTEIGDWGEDGKALKECETLAVDGALALLALETGEDHHPFFEHTEEMMTRNLGSSMIMEPKQLCGDRVEHLRGGWLPTTVQYDIECPAEVTREEELSTPFKHSKHADTMHWQCQSYTFACTKCRAEPATQAIESLPELSLEELEYLSRNCIWRFELHRAFQSIKEALIHTAIDEYLEAFEAEQNALLKATEAEQKTFTSENETGIRGGYLSGLGDNQGEDDHEVDTGISAEMRSILQAFQAVAEAVMITAQLDFKTMLHCPEYSARCTAWEKFGIGHNMHKMRLLERLSKSWKICHALSFGEIEDAMIATAVLGGRATNIVEKAKILGERLVNIALERLDQNDMEEFADEHREYAAPCRRYLGVNDVTDNYNSRHESRSELSSWSAMDYAMVMRTSLTVPAPRLATTAFKIIVGTNGTKVKKEVIGFPSGAELPLFWLGGWGLVIPSWQSRARRSSKEGLRIMFEAREALKQTLWDDGITQSPKGQDLSFPDYPWEPSNLSSRTSLRGGASGLLGAQRDLPYPEFPWEPSNLSSATSLRGGGNVLFEVDEAAQSEAYVSARPQELHELAMRPEDFNPLAGDRICGLRKNRSIQKHNWQARPRATALHKSRYLRRAKCWWPAPTQHDPGFVYHWKYTADDAFNCVHGRNNWDRRNRRTRGTMMADKRNGSWFWHVTGIRFAQRNCGRPSQRLVRGRQWLRGARRSRIFEKEFMGSLSSLRGPALGSSPICGGIREFSSGVFGLLRGGQLTNEDEKNPTKGFENHEAQITNDQESQSEAVEDHNDAQEYLIQCSGQDDQTTSPSNETSKSNNTFSYPPRPSSLSLLNQTLVPSLSSRVASSQQTSLANPKCTGLEKTMTWIALNKHHKNCKLGICANPCRAIVTLPLKLLQTEPTSKLQPVNAIAYWFGEEAEALCNLSSGALRGGFLKDEKEEGKEDVEERDWRSANSLRDGEPDPLANFLMRQRFSRRLVDIGAQEIHVGVGRHNHDCQPGLCSLFCRASGTLPAPDKKTKSHGNPDALLAYAKKASPIRTGISSSVSEEHPYSQRIAELNRVLGLTVRTNFQDVCCVEGHTHPELMHDYAESEESRQSFRRLKGGRPNRNSERQQPHSWHVEFSQQVQIEEPRPLETPERGRPRGGDLDEAFKMPRSGVNGWLFDRSTNWTFRRARVTSKGSQGEIKGTGTTLHSGQDGLQLPDSPPLTPVVGHEAEKVATAFDKMSFVSPINILPLQSRNAPVSSKSCQVALEYALAGKFDPYLCWPEWAYKLYNPPHNAYDSPTYDITGRWRRPVSRHLLAGILETLPETTGMFRRMEDGTIIRIGLQEMTAEERKIMLQYAKGKKTMRRDYWGLHPCLEAMLVVEEADEMERSRKGLRGGALEYPLSGPLAVHFDGDIRWSFRCCGRGAKALDSPPLQATPHEATILRQSSTDSGESEEAIILSPTELPFSNEPKSKWYSRPVDATKLKTRLHDLLNPKIKRFKDKHGNMVHVGFPEENSRSFPSRKLKPSEVLLSKNGSQKERAPKSNIATRSGFWVLRGGGLRGGGLVDDEGDQMEMDYPSRPSSDDDAEDQGYFSVSFSSPSSSDIEKECEEVWEDPEDDTIDEQEMDYELSVDTLPLKDAYADSRTMLREGRQKAIEMIERACGNFGGEKLQPKCSSELRSAGHETLTSIAASVEDGNEKEPDEEPDYDPDLENIAPAIYEVNACEVRNITRTENMSTLSSSCRNPSLPDPCSSSSSTNSSPSYSSDVSTRASSVSATDAPPKGMWVMVHPRVTQLLVSGTHRYKSKHLEKTSGLMRLHDGWANGTPKSMRLMTSSSAFRYELQKEWEWERSEKERLRSMGKSRQTLQEIEADRAEAEDIDVVKNADEKEQMEVLVREVSSDFQDSTVTSAITDTNIPDKEKEKTGSDTILPTIETEWTTPSIQLFNLRRPSTHMVPGESEKSLQQKAKRLMTDHENVRLEAEERRRAKLERMVCIMKQTKVSSTRSMEGSFLRGGLGYVANCELETLSELSGATVKNLAEDGEQEEIAEEREENIMDVIREISEERVTMEEERRNARLARILNMAYISATSFSQKHEGKDLGRKSSNQGRKERRKGSIMRGLKSDRGTEYKSVAIPPHSVRNVLKIRRLRG